MKLIISLCLFCPFKVRAIWKCSSIVIQDLGYFSAVVVAVKSVLSFQSFQNFVSDGSCHGVGPQEFPPRFVSYPVVAWLAVLSWWLPSPHTKYEILDVLHFPKTLLLFRHCKIRWLNVFSCTKFSFRLPMFQCKMAEKVKKYSGKTIIFH